MGEYFDESLGGEPSADAPEAGMSDDPEQGNAVGGAILPGEDIMPFDIGSTIESGAQILARASGNAGLGQLANFRGLRIGGPNGLEAGSDTGGSPGLLPVPGGGGGASHAIWAGIIAKVSSHLGRRATHATVRYLLNRFGAGAANALGLSEDEVLFVFGFGKRRKSHRRGPGLYTIAKRIRQAERMQHTVRRILGKHIGRTAAPKHRFHHRKKRR